MRVVLLGPPGAGKGTQAARLSQAHGWAHVATGELLRRAIADGTDLGRRAEFYVKSGGLVPDDLVVAMVQDRLRADDARGGCVLDGFPRTRAQADALAAFAPPDLTLFLDVPEEDLLRRFTGRRTCSQCGAVYHVDANPPKTEGHCNRCGGPLVQREDDREDVVRRRLNTYAEATRPLLDHYSRLGLLVRVDGGGGIEAVAGRLDALVRDRGRTAK